MSSNLEIGLSDGADIWHTGSLTVSAQHGPGLVVTLQLVRLNTAKISCMGWVAYRFLISSGWEIRKSLSCSASGLI